MSDYVKDLFVLSINDFSFIIFMLFILFNLLSILIKIFSCSYFRKFQGTDVQINISRFYVFFYRTRLGADVGKAAADREFKGLADCIKKCYKVRQIVLFVQKKNKKWGGIENVYK